MHMLKQTFEEKNFKTSAAVGLKFQCKECEFGRMQEKIYSDVDANGLGFKCPQCKSELVECSQENLLNEEEQKTTRRLLERF